MCRWLAYSGTPVLLADVLFTPIRSFIDQSRRSRLSDEITNGDGFGIGWYDDQETAGVFRSTEPAWGNTNLSEVAKHVTSPLFFAHIRAAVGSSIQEANCHPFRYGRWLWMHNGYITDYSSTRRDLAFAVDPSLYSLIGGTTDSETLFYLALTYGLEDDPPAAMARTIGLVEASGRAAGIDCPFQGTVATSDGESMWAFRYSSRGSPQSLFINRHVPTLRREYPEASVLSELSDDTRLVVSEPIGNLPGAWVEVPESTYAVVRTGQDDLHPFAPTVPSGRFH